MAEDSVFNLNRNYNQDKKDQIFQEKYPYGLCPDEYLFEELVDRLKLQRTKEMRTQTIQGNKIDNPEFVFPLGIYF
jgi:hypothetical protein